MIRSKRMWRSVPPLLAVALLLGAGAALAAPEETESQARSEKTQSNKRVCRRVKVTGSHLPERVCMREREWDRLREEAQQIMDDARPSADPAEGGG